MNVHWCGEIENSTYDEVLKPIFNKYGKGIYFMYLNNVIIDEIARNGLAIIMYDLNITSPKTILANYNESSLTLFNITKY